jgi:hypothetical protein
VCASRGCDFDDASGMLTIEMDGGSRSERSARPMRTVRTSLKEGGNCMGFLSQFILAETKVGRGVREEVQCS